MKILTVTSRMLGTMLVGILVVGTAQAKSDKPKIRVSGGEDMGQSNISAYTRGMMGYQTPNIDRIANEGMMFTD